MRKIKRFSDKRPHYDNQQREKEVTAYYIFEDQIDYLDEVSGGNPSRLLRNILDQVLLEESESRRDSIHIRNVPLVHSVWDIGASMSAFQEVSIDE